MELQFAMSKPATATTALEQHPLALQLVPGTMPEAEFAAFSESIVKKGQHQPIIMFEGKILDGWHRYMVCTKYGLTPKFKEYDGDDAAGFVIALNVLRRKLGTTQRALAGARLNLDFKISQDEASKRVGVSKLHINLVCQALNSKNARLIKMLENPDLSREALVEEMTDCGIINPANRAVPVATHAAGNSSISAAGAGVGLESVWGKVTSGEAGDDLGDEESQTDDAEMGDILGDPPSANGKVIAFKPTTEGGNPVIGSRVQHPERRNIETPAYKMAQAFKGLTEPERISFMQISWHVIRPLLTAAGLSTLQVTPAELANAPAPAKPAPSKALSAQAAKVAMQAIDKAANTTAAALVAGAAAPAGAPATGAKGAGKGVGKGKAVKAA